MDSTALESRNPFDEEPEDKEGDASAETIGEEDTETEDEGDQFELPEWLAELSDDLEVYIAQREFEQAVNLIFRAETFCANHEDSPLIRAAKNKLENRKKHLLGVLTNELSTEKSVQGGPRSARRAVHLLVRLGRSAEAVDLFLKHRGAILHSALKYDYDFYKSCEKYFVLVGK